MRAADPGAEGGRLRTVIAQTHDSSAGTAST